VDLLLQPFSQTFSMAVRRNPKETTWQLSAQTSAFGETRQQTGRPTTQHC